MEPAEQRGVRSDLNVWEIRQFCQPAGGWPEISR